MYAQKHCGISVCVFFGHRKDENRGWLVYSRKCDGQEDDISAFKNGVVNVCEATFLRLKRIMWYVCLGTLYILKTCTWELKKKKTPIKITLVLILTNYTKSCENECLEELWVRGRSLAPYLDLFPIVCALTQSWGHAGAISQNLVLGTEASFLAFAVLTQCLVVEIFARGGTRTPTRLVNPIRSFTLVLYTHTQKKRRIIARLTSLGEGYCYEGAPTHLGFLLTYFYVL